MDDVQHQILTAVDGMRHVLKVDANEPVLFARELQDWFAVHGEDWSLSSLYGQLNRLIVAGYILAGSWPGGFTRTKLACPTK